VVKISPETNRKGIFITFFIALLVLSFFIIKPFISAILVSLVLAYIFYPVYKLVNKKIKNKNVAAFTTTIIVIFLIVVPSFFILNTISREAIFLYSASKDKMLTGDFLEGVCMEEGKDFSCKITNFFRRVFSHPQIQQYLGTTIKEAVSFLVEKIRDFLFSIPARILNFFVMMFVVFFLFRDGKKFVEKVEDLLPLKKAHKKQVFVKFNDTAFAVIYGSLIVAIIQGSLGGIGFFAVGIKNPLIWAVIMMFFALVPFVGTVVVWLPAALILIFNGYVQSDTLVIVKGIGLLVYGTFVISFIDNLIKPKIIGDRAKVHPVLVLLGVLGGLHFFGFIGIIVGPLVLALLVTFIKIYEEEGYF
jgi:predicted PurR-regulated permease PerM